MFDFDDDVLGGEDVPQEGAAADGSGGGGEQGRPSIVEKPENRKDFDPYKALGVPFDATDGAIKSAFRKLSLKVHPDRNPSPEAATQFRELMEVKDFLLTPNKRLWYNLTHGMGQVTTNVKWWLDWDELFRELEPSVPREGAEAQAPGAVSALPEGRQVDILIFGATGFTGMLACANMEQRASGRTWAIAGRDERKLRLLEQKFGRADAGFRGATRLGSPEEIDRLVASARVVVDLSGPKWQVGSFVAEACVRTGTHYVDTSGFEGDVLHARKVKDKLDERAKAAGVSLVFFCAAYMVHLDLGAWFMAKQLRERHGLRMRRLDVYQHYIHFTISGTTSLAWVGQKGIEKEVEDYGWPFLLGGERPGGVREEDKDPLECTQDEHHPDLWLTPGEKNAGVMITRYSAGLFDGTKENWGDKFCFKVRDLQPSQQAGEGLIMNNLIFRKGYAKYLAEGKCPPPGSGARERVRKEGVPTRVFVAEVDEAKGRSRRRRFHFVSSFGPGGWGNPDEGTADMALSGAHCLLDALDRGAELRPGFGTPSWHLAHLGFYERVMEHGQCSDLTEGFAPRALFQTVMSGAMNLGN